MELSQSKSLMLPWLIMGVVLITIPLSLRETFDSMIQIWLNSRTFNHCFLILPVSAFLIWGRREQLSKIRPAASVSVIYLIVAAGLLWILGALANVVTIQQFAAVALVPFSIWAVLGRRIATEIAFPLLYLLLMVPFGEFLIPRLMDFTADFAVAAARFSGVPIYRDGLFLIIPNGSFRVIETCSGIRMLIASVAVGVAFAHVAFSSWKRWILFMVVTVLLPIVANGLRAYVIVMMGHLISMDAAGDHILLGYIIFAIVIIVLLVGGSLYSDKEADATEPVNSYSKKDSPSMLSSFLSAVVVIAVVAITPITAAALHSSTLRQESAESLSLPVATGQWTGPSEAQINWMPVYTGSYEQDFGQYVSSSAAVDVYTITYVSQKQGSELISSENTIYDKKAKGWTQTRENAATTELPNGQQWTYTELELLVGSTKRLVRYWYTVNNKPSSSRIQVKLAELWNAIQGRPSSSSVIAVSTKFFEDTQTARAVLDEFYATVFADSMDQSD